MRQEKTSAVLRFQKTKEPKAMHNNRNIFLRSMVPRSYHVLDNKHETSAPSTIEQLPENSVMHNQT